MSLDFEAGSSASQVKYQSRLRKYNITLREIKVYYESVCVRACLPDAGIDMRTPRNFLMRADRKVLSFLALGKTKKQKQETSQKLKNSYKEMSL